MFPVQSIDQPLKAHCGLSLLEGAGRGLGDHEYHLPQSTDRSLKTSKKIPVYHSLCLIFMRLVISPICDSNAFTKLIVDIRNKVTSLKRSLMG